MTGVLLTYGNCQAGIINAMSNTLLRGKYECVYVPSAISIGAATLSDAAAERCEILLEQIGIEQSFPFLDRLSPHVRRVTFPSLNLLAPWPFTCHDPRNRPEPPEYPFGRYPYGDRIALRLWSQGWRGREAAGQYMEASRRSMPDVTRLLDKEFARAALVEAACEVKIADYLCTNFRSKRLFYTYNHPTRELIHILFEKIWQTVAFQDALVTASQILEHRKQFLSETNRWRPFEDYQQPVHPEVSQQLNFRWWQPDVRYFVSQIGHPVTHEEFFEWYLTEQVCIEKNQRTGNTVNEKISHPPVFEHLIKSSTNNLDAAVSGLAIFRDCSIINPDGTGFGGGRLEIRITDAQNGDRLWLRRTHDISGEEQNIYFRGRTIARGSRVDDPISASAEIRICFEAGVYFDAIAAILASVVLSNPCPAPGTRRISISVTDADNDHASTAIEVSLTP